MAINTSLTNITVEPAFLTSVIDYIKEFLWPRFIELITAPYYHRDMIWIITPMLTVLFLMELYFGRYKKEKLGWNTAVGNSIVLFFVSVDLFRHIYTYAAYLNFWQFVSDNLKGLFVALIVGLGGMWFLIANFFHILPKKLAFFISGSLPINMIAYIAIAVVYSEVPFDLITVTAGLILFIILTLFFGLVHLIEPKHKYKEKKEEVAKPIKKEGKNEKQKD